MQKNTLGVALVKRACPLCGKIEDGEIIMNTRLSERAAKKVEELNGKTIGLMDKPCSECADIMSKAFLIIGIIEEKSEDPKNPYRSGNIWGIKKESALEILGA